jgi:hypothetical protein
VSRELWDEDVTPVGDVPAERILEAVKKARDAFWASVAESFPEVTTGDMAPGDEVALEFATNEVLLVWLMYNHPSARG